MTPHDSPENNKPRIDDAARRISTAPAVPKELLSARPAMTNIRPQWPDEVQKQAAAKAAAKPEPTPEELQERQERLDYLRSLRSEKPKKKWPKVLATIILILVLMAAGAGAAYYFLVLKGDKPTTQSDMMQVETNQPTNIAETPEPAAELKDYTSINFPLSLSFPDNWTVSDQTAKLTILSPPRDMKSATGTNTKAAVLITIRGKQTNLPEFDSGNASAVLLSEKVNYTQPSSTQRGQTYLSYLQYAATKAKGGMDAVYITGNSGYTQGQFIPETDVIKVDPLVTVTFVSCQTSCMPTSTSVAIDSATWTGDTKKQVEAILTSLTID